MREEHTIFLKEVTTKKRERGRKKRWLFIPLLILCLNFALFRWTGLFTHNNKLSVVFLLDTSFSMAGEPLFRGIDSIWAGLYSLKEGTRASLVTFSDMPLKHTPLSNEYGPLLMELTRVEAWGETDFAGGLRMAEELLQEEGADRKREILLLTDGSDGTEQLSLDFSMELAEQGIHVTILGLTGRENAGIKLLAERTGGEAVYDRKEYLHALKKLKSTQDGRRLGVFLTLTAAEETAAAFLTLYFKRGRKRRGSLPNAGYMDREEIASFLESGK